MGLPLEFESDIILLIDSVGSLRKEVIIMADIDNYEDKVVITGTAAADSIYNHFGSSVTIDGNAGDDFIDNSS